MIFEELPFCHFPPPNTSIRGRDSQINILVFQPNAKQPFLSQSSHVSAMANSVKFCSRYGTVYTMFPVSSLVLDEDVPADIALIYPELYKDLSKVGNKYRSTLLFYVSLSDILWQFLSTKEVFKYVCSFYSSQGRSLSYKTFFIWVLISIYQGKCWVRLSIPTFDRWKLLAWHRVFLPDLYVWSTLATFVSSPFWELPDTTSKGVFKNLQ